MRHKERKMLNVPMTPSDYQKLRVCAAQRGLAMAVFVRDVLKPIIENGQQEQAAQCDQTLRQL